MTPRPDPAARPSRLSILLQITVPILIGTSFITGIMLWRGALIQEQTLSSPDWLHPARVAHGLLSTMLAILFGALLAHHIRIGWQLRANLLSGFFLEFMFALLIVTGLGLHYLGDPYWGAVCLWTHRVAGVAFPLALAAHWWGAWRWIRWGRTKTR